MEIMVRIFAVTAAIVLLVSGCGEGGQALECEATSESAVSETIEEIPTDVTEPFFEEKSPVYGKVIVVDAGHGLSSINKQEAIAPNSSETKAAFVSGTRGASQTEEQLNLAVALKLQSALLEKGAVVYMTRSEHESNMTNIDRAVFANDLGADISVKIHADGNNNSGVHGVSVLVPGDKYINDGELIKKSREAGEIILKEFVAATGASNRGISVRNDLTGFNWSKVPIVLVEMGFMTNPEEDRLMATDDYQNKMVLGIVRGLELYFENN